MSKRLLGHSRINRSLKNSMTTLSDARESLSSFVSIDSAAQK